MNILTQPLPKVDKYKRPIRTDHRHWINFLRAIQDPLMPTEGERVAKALELVYKQPEYTQKEVDGAVSFLNGWIKSSVDSNGTPDGRKYINVRTTDFDIDAEAIYVSFWQQYGINLSAKTLHWYEFRILLAGLTKETPHGYAMFIRALNLKDVKDKHLRKEYEKDKKRLALPEVVNDEPTPQAMVAEFLRKANGNG